MNETKELIVDLSNYACSIIIVGIGNADFETMEELDSDKQRLKDKKGRVCKRDIV